MSDLACFVAAVLRDKVVDDLMQENEKLTQEKEDLLQVLSYELRVICLTGRIYRVHVKYNATVDELKAILAEKSGIRARDQRLFFQRREMSGECTLRSYGMMQVAGDRIRLILRLRGGARVPRPGRRRRVDLNELDGNDEDDEEENDEENDEEMEEEEEENGN